MWQTIVMTIAAILLIVMIFDIYNSGKPKTNKVLVDGKEDNAKIINKLK